MGLGPYELMAIMPFVLIFAYIIPILLVAEYVAWRTERRILKKLPKEIINEIARRKERRRIQEENDSNETREI